MIARLLICPALERIRDEINKTLACNLSGYRTKNSNHPDLLYFKTGEKLGIAEARIIKAHFALKPYSASGRAVIIENAASLTPEAQNALLKTLEEPPKEAILILGAKSDADLLPTILSRCKIVRLNATDLAGPTQATCEVYIKDLKKLLDSSIEERFEYIEKLKDREEFLRCMVYFFRQKMIEPDTHKRSDPQGRTLKFLQELLQAEKRVKQNVNIRAILEYLMLVMPDGK